MNDIVGLVLFAVYFLVVIGVGSFIFSPFKLVIERPPTVNKTFQITDLFGFFLSVQLILGASRLVYFDVDWNPAAATSIVVVALVFSAMSWFYGLRLLWRTNISSWLKRIVLLGLVMPFGMLLSIFASILVVANTESVFYPLQVLGLGAGIFAIRLLGIWVLSGDRPISADDQNQPNEFDRPSNEKSGD